MTIKDKMIRFVSFIIRFISPTLHTPLFSKHVQTSSLFGFSRSVFTVLVGLTTLVSLHSFADHKVVVLKDISYFPTHELNAQSIALERSAIAPQLSGNIKSVLAEVGDSVKRGQTLATLDCTLRKNDLTIARIKKQQIVKRIQLQEKSLRRQFGLLKNQNISQSLVDETETNMAINRSSLREQEVRIKSLAYNVSLCRINAPFSGTIVQKNAQLGQSISPSISAFTLLNTKKVQIKVPIPQYLLSDFQKADSLQFISKKRIYQLKKSTVIPQFSKNRTIEARLILEQPLTPGTYGIVRWKSKQPYLPPKYLKRSKEQLGVYFINNNKIDFHPIRDAQEGRNNPIDLPPATKIITHSSHTKIEK